MKLGLIGTANSGKTTLIKELEKRKVFKNHVVINEVAGKFPKSSRKSLNTQYNILRAQMAEEDKYTNFISDRTVIDNYTYFMWHYKNTFNKIRYGAVFANYMDNFNYHMSQKPYDQLIFINEYFDLEDNGIREMDEKMQEWVFSAASNCADLYSEIYNIPLSDVSGTIDERIAQIKEICAPHYKQKRISDYARP